MKKSKFNESQIVAILKEGEAGRQDGHSRAAFSSHQSKVRAVLSDWADERGWVRIDSDLPREAVLRQVLSCIDGATHRDRNGEALAA